MEHVVFDGAQVMVGDPQLLQNKISSIRRDGPVKLQVWLRLLQSLMSSSGGKLLFIYAITRFCSSRISVIW